MAAWIGGMTPALVVGFCFCFLVGAARKNKNCRPFVVSYTG
jgi:hypothetical protein